MSSVYTGRSLPHTWCPERQLFGILNVHAMLQLGFEVRGLAYGYIGVWTANSLTLDDFYWLLL
jgi:hypothetical protein